MYFFLKIGVRVLIFFFEFFYCKTERKEPRASNFDSSKCARAAKM